MKVLVCGGRDLTDSGFVFRHLDEQYRRYAQAGRGWEALIHGNADGADKIAGVWAENYGIQEVMCPANWRKHGKPAGMKRNRAMLTLGPDLVIAFPTEQSRGTHGMVREARAALIPCLVFPYPS